MKQPCVAIALDLHKASADKVVVVRHRDIGRKIAISLWEEGFPYEIAEDCYGVLTATKPDGNILYNHCDIADNTLYYEVTEQTTAAVGRMPAEVKLYGPDDRLITSAAFRILVEGTLCPEGQLESREEVSALTHLVSEASAVIQTGSETIRQAEEAVQATQEAKATLEESQVRLNQWLETSNQIFREIRADADLAVEAANSAAENADAAASELGAALAAVNTAVENAGSSAEEAYAAARETAAAKENLLQAAEDALDAVYEAVAEATDAPAIVCNAHGQVIALADSAERLLQGLRVFGKTTQNGTPSPETPVPLESVGDVNVTVAGKNLFVSRENAITMAGVTVTPNGDGSFVLNGTASEDHANSVSEGFPLPAGKYTFTFTGANKINSNYDRAYIRANGTIIANYIFTDIPKTVELSEASIVDITLILGAGSSYSNKTVKFQIEAGETATSWEPYKEVQPLSISTSNGLPGIPVTSGGNYTDENGQQWLCNEVDFEKGKYEQRVMKFGFGDLTGFARQSGAYDTENRIMVSAEIKALTDRKMPGRKGKCNMFPYSSVSVQDKYRDITAFNFHPEEQYSSYVYFKLEKSCFSALDDETVLSEFQAMISDIEILCEIPEPIETPLSAEQLAAFTALHTSFPNTTVFNDAGAEMEVKYVADTRLYIDNKFNELATALVNNM